MLQYDVIIIGGSYAGLSAALALGRALRKVLVLDSGKPANAVVDVAHNMLSYDGIPPAELKQKAIQQLLHYKTVKLVHEEALAVRREIDNSFTVATASQHFTSRKIIFATGVLDILPNIKGLQACWGKTVVHCPYCHGFEAAHMRFALLANGEHAYLAASNLLQWSKQITIFSNGPSNLSEDHVKKLQQHNINIVTHDIAEVEHDNGVLHTIKCSNGQQYKVDRIFTRPLNMQHCEHVDALGVQLSADGLIVANEWGATNIYGVYACGDCTQAMRTIAIAIGDGNKVAIGINREMTVEEF
ncbi:MAG: hypothetical protein RL660_653 [Bacteroidota bacterium]|jgi:thioredoxin reductase